MEWLEKINSAINDFVWGVPMIITIILVGVFFTIRLRFIQFIHPGLIVKETIGKQFSKSRSKESGNNISSFQAAMTSVAAIVGSGNIAGVATAIVFGGPGAVFWLLIAAFVGMATKFAEIALGVKYRKLMKDGSYEGGPMYYLRDGLGKNYKWLKWLGYVYAFLVIPTAFILCAIVDTNTMTGAIKTEFGIKPIYTGIVLAILVAIVVFGGTKRVSKLCGKMTPILGSLFLLSGIVLIFYNIKIFPEAIRQILIGAFNPKSITGGAIGSIFIVMRYGVARGIFSNEAGLGTAAMIHSNSNVDHPIKQALWGPFEVFFDTCVACFIVAISIIMSGLWQSGEYEGAGLTMKAFEALLPGKVGTYIILASILLFGFSCLISYFTYAERSVIFLFGEKAKIVIKPLWVISIVLGSMTTLGLAWGLADTFNGLMILPNLIGIVLLSGEVVKMKKEYFDSLKVKKES